jgi:hypothetical protein
MRRLRARLGFIGSEESIRLHDTLNLAAGLCRAKRHAGPVEEQFFEPPAEGTEESSQGCESWGV